MKLLFLSRAYPPITGGLENHNYELHSALRKKTHIDSIINKKGKKALPLFMPFCAFKALYLSSEYDVVLLGDGVLASVGWLIKLFRPSVPVICIVHGLDLTYSNRIYQYFWISKFLPKMDKIIAVSHATADAAIERGIKRSKLEIIPNGINPWHDTISHPYSMGNGAAIKTGARNSATHASILRKLANTFYNRLASLMTGYKIEDLTSGFRVVRARHFKIFLYLLPNGFSYPTTSTMAFFRSGLPVAYVPIHAGIREGKSHISLVKDGIRFFIIIVKIGALFPPMRLFLPVSASLFFIGMGYYSYTYISTGRFTNMNALLLTSALITFMMSLISGQISSLHYKDIEKNQRKTERK